MALEYNRLRDQHGGGSLIADRRLLLAADRETMVESNDPRGSYLLACEGGEIQAPEVARLRLAIADGRVVQQGEQKEAEKSSDKQAEKPADKSRGKGEDKGTSRKR